MYEKNIYDTQQQTTTELPALDFGQAHTLCCGGYTSKIWHQPFRLFVYFTTNNKLLSISILCQNIFDCSASYCLKLVFRAFVCIKYEDMMWLPKRQKYSPTCNKGILDVILENKNISHSNSHKKYMLITSLYEILCNNTYFRVTLLFIFKVLNFKHS